VAPVVSTGVAAFNRRKRQSLYSDTHCHLSLIEGDSAESVLRRAQDAGVGLLVDVGTDLASSAECVRTAAAYETVYASVGIHPHNAIEATEHVIRRLASLAAHPKVVGIGETGLDWFREQSPRVRQDDAFRDHIRLAKELDKTLVVHNRDASDDVVGVLDAERPPDRVVFHCFSGDTELVKTCADRGWFMSFAGNVTFSNADALRELAAAAPLDLLLSETDAPFLTPHPHRGKPNDPSYLPHTVQVLAEVQNRPVDDVAAALAANAQRAFALPTLSERSPSAAPARS
jgi:TatD DNase family protein